MYLISSTGSLVHAWSVLTQRWCAAIASREDTVQCSEKLHVAPYSTERIRCMRDRAENRTTCSASRWNSRKVSPVTLPDAGIPFYKNFTLTNLHVHFSRCLSRNNLLQMNLEIRRRDSASPSLGLRLSWYARHEAGRGPRDCKVARMQRLESWLSYSTAVQKAEGGATTYTPE